METFEILYLLWSIWTDVVIIVRFFCFQAWCENSMQTNFKVTESDFLNQKLKVWIRIETIWKNGRVLDVLITEELRH